LSQDAEVCCDVQHQHQRQLTDPRDGLGSDVPHIGEVAAVAHPVLKFIVQIDTSFCGL
jgi:hypothetical protein